VIVFKEREKERIVMCDVICNSTSWTAMKCIAINSNAVSDVIIHYSSHKAFGHTQNV